MIHRLITLALALAACSPGHHDPSAPDAGTPPPDADPRPCEELGECVVDPSNVRIDIRTAALAGAVSIDGPLECARLVLEGAGGTHTIELPCHGATRSFAARLPAPRVYDVYLSLPSGAAVLARGFVLEADRTNVAFHVGLVSASGRITQDGAPPIERAGCTGAAPVAITFDDRDDGRAAVTTDLRCGSGFAFDRVLLQRDRAYAVRISSRTGTTSLPDAASVAATDFRASPEPAVFDLRTAIVTGSITVNGEAPAMTGCTTRAASVRFRDLAQGTTHAALLPCNTDWSFAVALPHGVYQVEVGGEAADLPLWVRVRDALAVSTAGTFSFDVVRVPVSATLTLNGAPWPSARCADTSVMFSSERTTVVAPMSCASPGSIEVAAPPGRYRVSVRGEQLPVAAGMRAIAIADDVELPAVAPLVLDVRSAAIAGTVSFGRAALPTLCGPESIAMLFEPLDAGASGTPYAFATCDGRFGVALPVGAYAVSAYAVNEPGNPAVPPIVVLRERLEVTGDQSSLALDGPIVRVSGAVTIDGAPPSRSGPCHTAAAVAQLSPAPDSPLINPAHAALAIPCDTTDGRFDNVPIPSGSHVVSISGSYVPPTTLPYRLRIE